MKEKKIVRIWILNSELQIRIQADTLEIKRIRHTFLSGSMLCSGSRTLLVTVRISYQLVIQGYVRIILSFKYLVTLRKNNVNKVGSGTLPTIPQTYTGSK